MLLDAFMSYQQLQFDWALKFIQITFSFVLLAEAKQLVQLWVEVDVSKKVIIVIIDVLCP